MSESDIITAKHSVYTNVPLVSNDTTLIDEDEEYILGTDEFSIAVALLEALKTTEQLTKSYQSDEQFVIVGSTYGNTQEYNEVVCINTMKKLFPLVEGLNKLFLVITKEGVKGFAEINQMFFNGDQAYEDGSDKLENCVIKLLDTFAAITGVHLDIHNSLEVLFKDGFADMDVGWVHQNQLVAEETSDEQSLFFKVLEEEENKSYTFEITMEIGDNIRHTQSQSIDFQKQNLGTNILLLKNCFEALRGIYLQTEARYFDRLGFLKEVADKIYGSFSEREKQAYLIKPPTWQYGEDVFHSPLRYTIPFSVGLHISFSTIPTKFGVGIRTNSGDYLGLFRSFSKEETYVEDAKAFILDIMEGFNPQKLAEVSERHDIPIFINNEPTSTQYRLRHPSLLSANILGIHEPKRCLLKINGGHQQSVTIPINIKEGVCIADKIDEILAIFSTRQDLFEELKNIGVSHE